MSENKSRQSVIALALCKSGKFETGEGTCAFACMSELGDARKKGCPHHPRVHAQLAERIADALAKSEEPRP